MKNIFVYTLGGNIGSPRTSFYTEDEDFIDAESDFFRDQDDNLEDFFCLLNNIFDDEATKIAHSAVFLNWQLNHPGTQVHPYLNKPSMNITALNEEKTIKESEDLLQQFKELYQYSTFQTA